MTTAAVNRAGGIPARFREVWLVDFEFRTDRGERPWVVCMVARELRCGREVRLWRDELLALDRAPFDTGPDALFVAFAASAEIGCMLELGWPTPENVLDLYFEFRRANNGRFLPHGNGMIGALAYHGLAHIGADEKRAMRELIIGRREWSDTERAAILEYCGSDVDALAALLPAMLR